MLATTLLMIPQVIAHPPENIDVQYSLSQQKLTVVITHVTSDPTTHYVEKVEVYKNNVTIIDEDYTSQPSNTFTLNFTLPAVVGDWIKVEARDNLGGKTQEEIIVTDDSSNNPPTTPVLNGETNGKIKVTYPYTVVSTDPDADQVYYWIDWGDGSNTGWIGPYGSGVEVTQSHMWTEKGSYTIKAKAKDVYGNESNWGQLSVTMPRAHNLPYMHFWERFFQRFPNAFPILQNLWGY